MTAQRREKKEPSTRWALFTPVVAGLAAVCAAGQLAQEAQAAFTERVVVNRQTGLAINGFDPVAYFTDGAATPGQPDIEVAAEGAIWRFRNEANKAFFVASPEIYGPQFGGYDPTGIARGVTAAGRPQLWLISRQRLYLFNTEDNRAAFAADPSRFSGEADSRWPVLKNGLAEY
jgi:hypothetical protein